jgi:hypothetical protein
MTDTTTIEDALIVSGTMIASPIFTTRAQRGLKVRVPRNH